MTAEQKATAKKALGITVQIAALLVITLQYAKSFSTPAMSAIGAAYAPAGVDSLMLKNIEGLPSLMAIVGAFAVGILERYMKKKTMLIIAMTCTSSVGWLLVSCRRPSRASTAYWRAAWCWVSAAA